MKYNVNDDNIFLIVHIIGLINALETQLLQPEECEVLLFNPYIAQRCRENNVDINIVNIIEKCMELDDIKRIVPYEFSNALCEIKNECFSYLQVHKKIEYPINKYFGL